MPRLLTAAAMTAPLALIAALAAAGAAGAAPQKTEAPKPEAAKPEAAKPGAPPAAPAWAAGLDTEGWTYLSSSDTVAVYARPPKAGRKGQAKMAIRYEYRSQTATDAGAILSAEETDRFDCPAARYRPERIVEYAGRGLTGRADRFSFKDAPWRTAEPGSLGERIVAAACAPAAGK